MNEFSVGLSLRGDMERYKRIFRRFEGHIDKMYFSLPLGRRYHGRKEIHRIFEDDPEALSRMIDTLLCAKDHGIELELALNTHMLDTADVIPALEFAYAHRVFPDSITAMKELAPHLSRLLPNTSLVCSYNNGVRTVEDVRSISPLFSEVVLGGAAIRDLTLFKQAKSQGLKTRLLLNNGCSFNCSWCRDSANCGPTFERNLREHDVEHLYALQSILPWELHGYYAAEMSIDSFKISNRSSDVDYLENCLTSYIRNLDEQFVDQMGGRAYYLWCRLGHFVKYAEEFDLERINEHKRSILTNL